MDKQKNAVPLSNEKRKKSAASTLPEELLIEILCRVQPESLVRCTAVCKSWNGLIRDPTFISKHLHNSSSNREKSPILMLRAKWRRRNKTYRCSLCVDNVKELKECQVFDFPFQSRLAEFSVLGFCNGIICLLDECTGKGHKCILWNPSIRKYYKLPPSTLPKKTRDCSFFSYELAFGFDSSIGDFKVLRFRRIFCPNHKQRRTFCPNHKQDYSLDVEVYSLKDGLWRIIVGATGCNESTDVRFTCLGFRREASCVNGCLHWIADRRGCVDCKGFILVFHLAREVFHEMALPSSTSDVDWLSWNIEALGESSLAAIHEEQCPKKYNIWVMKEYGAADSWTKIWSFDTSGVMLSKTLGFKNGELLIRSRNGDPILLDFNAQQAYKPQTNGLPLENCISAKKFVQSLVLIDKGEDVSTCLEDRWYTRHFRNSSRMWERYE